SADRLVTEALVWMLPLSLIGRAALLVLLHLGIAAAGAYLLGRSFGVRREYALMIAFVAALNGFQLWWGTAWYPSIASFAWLPWYWLAIRSIETKRSFITAALTLYLVITAGWPFAAATAGIVAPFELLRDRARQRILRIVGASLL